MQSIHELLVPAADRALDARLQLLLGDLGKRGSLGCSHDEVQLGEGGFSDAGSVVDLAGVEGRAQQFFDAQANRGVVAVSRQVDERGGEAAELIAPQEDAVAAPFAKPADLGGHGVEVFDAVLEELVARVLLEGLEEVLA